MTGPEFKQLRLTLGLSQCQFAEQLGYEGNRDNNHTTINRFEKGERPISPPVARLAWMLAQYGIQAWPEMVQSEEEV